MYETDLAFCAAYSYEMGQVPSESYAERMKHTQAKSHDFKRLLGDIPSSDGNHLVE